MAMVGFWVSTTLQDLSDVRRIPAIRQMDERSMRIGQKFYARDQALESFYFMMGVLSDHPCLLVLFHVSKDSTADPSTSLCTSRTLELARQVDYDSARSVRMVY